MVIIKMGRTNNNKVRPNQIVRTLNQQPTNNRINNCKTNCRMVIMIMMVMEYLMILILMMTGPSRNFDESVEIPGV